MPDISKTQLRYLSFIHAYTAGFGMPPSMQEIADALKVSGPSVNSMLKSLEKKALIERQPGVARSIEILVDSKLIPAWKKKIVSSFKFWAPADASQQWLDQRTDAIIQHRQTERLKAKKQKQLAARLAPGETPTVYCFKISLMEFKPAIWRRIETLDVTLAELHDLIQTAMGWTNSHLHAFQIAGQEYVDSSSLEDDFGAIDYDGIWIGDLVREHGSKLKFQYDYDFGDGWKHTVALEKMQPLAGAVSDLPRCLAGAHECPPEDVGGVWGFADYLQAINDPSHREHEQMLDWSGPYDFEHFEINEVTERMRAGILHLF
jgi:Plasmid pRiA4b ORF-3-like protein/LexA DNA binding domain